MANTSGDTSLEENQIMPSNAPPDVVSGAEKELKGTSQAEWPSPILGAKDQAPKSLEIKPRKRRDPMTIERSNLLTVFKLVIKELIDSSLSHGRMLDDDHLPLQQFFVVLEHVLRHGIKPKKGILRDRREFWAVLEQVERFVPEASDITTSVKEMPNVKSPLGRGRAWLRLALMQKKLSDYFREIVDRRDIFLVDAYEPGAMMLGEEAQVIAGLLVGLNVIDCNMGIKDEDLDQPMGVIDFSLYLNQSFQPETSEEESQGSAKMAAILDQKNYLEELNRHLNATVTNLQQKVEALSTANTLMKEDLAIAKNNLLELQQENSTLRGDRDGLLESHKTQIETARQDIKTERDTYETSRQGLDGMYQDAQKRLQEEIQMRLDVEKELQLQISMKQETEMALRLLEKDIHEKQDSVIALRKQLDDIKAINLQMFEKLQASESTLQHKMELVGKLEEKSNQMAATIKQLEDKLKESHSDKLAAELTARKVGQHLAEKDAKRSALETDLKIEREWRGTLQKHLETEKEKVTRLQNEHKQLKEVSKEYEALKDRHKSLQGTCEDQEKALAELGSHLSESKLRMEDLREEQLALKEAQWADDKEVIACRNCTKPFSVSRRKHHCRNCGEIFCNECSDNKMPLPSSAKAVRVCDPCQTKLLQRYSAN